MPGRATFRISLAILLIAAGSIGSAWIFEALGYAPCELCLKERLPYYVGVPLAGLAVYFAATGWSAALGVVFAGLSFIFTASAGFGAYHAGIEWGFWPGPTDCTGPLDHAASITDFLAELRRVKVIRCDAAALRIVGLSLAGWNAVVSAVLALLAFVGAWEARRIDRSGCDG